MKRLTLIIVSTLLAFSAPAFAQDSTDVSNGQSQQSSGQHKHKHKHKPQSGDQQGGQGQNGQPAQ